MRRSLAIMILGGLSVLCGEPACNTPRVTDPAAEAKSTSARSAVRVESQAATTDPLVIVQGHAAFWLWRDGRFCFTSDAAPALRGDLNCDGTVDFSDINPFVYYLSDQAGWLVTYPGCNPRNGDINCDGTYPSFKDLNPFVKLLTNRPPVAVLRVYAAEQPQRGDADGDGVTYSVADVLWGLSVMDVPLPINCDAFAAEAMNVRYKQGMIIDLGDVAVWQREVGR